MAKPVFPWRDGRSLAQVLVDGRPWLERKRLIRKGRGCAPSALAAAEKRLGQPLPPDVGEFLRAVQPIALFEDGKINDDGPGEFFFYGPHQAEFRWESLADWVPESDWGGARGLAIGQTGYGDMLYWVTGHRVHPAGCIAVFDHELAMGDLAYFVIARSLAEFIAKVVYCNGMSPGGGDDLDDDEDDEGDDPTIDFDADVEKMRLFSREYAELNPATESHKGR